MIIITICIFVIFIIIIIIIIIVAPPFPFFIAYDEMNIEILHVGISHSASRILQCRSRCGFDVLQS